MSSAEKLRGWRRMMTAALVAFLVVACVSVPSASAGSNWGPEFRSCGSFDAAYKIVVSASHMGCRKATKIQKELWLGPEGRQESVNGGSGALGYVLLKRFPGWKCSSGSGGGSCRKGRKVSAYENYPLPQRPRSVDYARCKDVVIRNPNGSVYTQTNGLFQKRTGCRFARRLAKKYLADDGIRPLKTLGFTCQGGSDGVACSKGAKRVTWGYYFDRLNA